MNIEDDKGLLGANWLVIMVAALIMWSTVIVVATAFLRLIVGTHTSWWWAITAFGIAGLTLVGYLVYRFVFAPRYSPELYEHRDFPKSEDDPDA